MEGGGGSGGGAVSRPLLRRRLDGDGVSAPGDEREEAARTRLGGERDRSRLPSGRLTRGAAGGDGDRDRDDDCRLLN